KFTDADAGLNPDDAEPLTHNRMLFPSTAKELQFKYLVKNDQNQPGSSSNLLQVVFRNAFGNVVPLEHFTDGFILVDENTDGFQTASIPIPADLIGKVGTFSIIARNTGAVTCPDVLVDDFRLVSDDIVITD